MGKSYMLKKIESHNGPSHVLTTKLLGMFYLHLFIPCNNGFHCNVLICMHNVFLS